MYTDIDFVNVDFIPGGADYPDRWHEEGAAYRERMAAIGLARLNVDYGAGERQKLDFFHPGGKAEGLVVFVHGGYWLRFDRSYWAQFSEGLTERGWVVAMPSYTLAPEARIRDITHETARAIETAARMVAGPVRLVGHSAGGHLVSRMANTDVVLDEGVRARIERIAPISPVTDLRPLLNIAMNETLQLDPEEAVAESPALQPASDIPVSVWVGAEERPVFLDQAIRLSEAWGAQLRVAPGRHHFDVIDGLRDPVSPLVESILTGRGA